VIPNFAARIRALDDERLEAFVKHWIDRRTRDYEETQRWSGTGDMGRDVVGYATRFRHWIFGAVRFSTFATLCNGTCS
jgi:hypothetical protein